MTCPLSSSPLFLPIAVRLCCRQTSSLNSSRQGATTASPIIHRIQSAKGFTGDLLRLGDSTEGEEALLMPGDQLHKRGSRIKAGNITSLAWPRRASSPKIRSSWVFGEAKSFHHLPNSPAAPAPTVAEAVAATTALRSCSCCFAVAAVAASSVAAVAVTSSLAPAVAALQVSFSLLLWAPSLRRREGLHLPKSGETGVPVIEEDVVRSDFEREEQWRAVVGATPRLGRTSRGVRRGVSSRPQHPRVPRLRLKLQFPRSKAMVVRPSWRGLRG
ncbi:hypothetical protein Taro_025008 [Colocasia esculenta]|uniref:Uncharacterized protein n=1 Tax=Colocasia esculenta TaxID=4460 RepID=A0A843V899_COLES|nr:hypothetical protein [Colocasia esculenta]